MDTWVNLYNSAMHFNKLNEDTQAYVLTVIPSMGGYLCVDIDVRWPFDAQAKQYVELTED